MTSMSSNIIHMQEHSFCSSMSEDDLVSLLKNPNPLIDINGVDLIKGGFTTGYCVGLSWLGNTKKALYVSPKLDTDNYTIDYLKMLTLGLQSPEMITHGQDLFSIDFNAKPILIRQDLDILTPLLIVNFLQVLYHIVRKGLKKDYFKTKQNRYASIKGKVLVSETINKNLMRSNNLYNVCSFDEYSINCIENRILKKALMFALRFLKMHHKFDSNFHNLLNFILPAFTNVDENISGREIKSDNRNTFFPEYSSGLSLADMILKRFGYSVQTINQNKTIEMYPFWINMPKLFEFYVLGILKDRIGRNEIIFQADAKYGELDFLRITRGKEMIIDAKYKNLYSKNNYEINDIRQLSAYARDIGSLKQTFIAEAEWGGKLLDCLIVYPDQGANNDEVLMFDECLKPIPQFQNFYKIGIKIPMKALLVSRS